MGNHARNRDFSSRAYENPYGWIMTSIKQQYLFVMFILLFCVVVYNMVPSMGVDFSLLYPAGEAVWDGENPYIAAPKFYNPPWMLLVLAPLSLLPIYPARWLWMVLGMFGYLLAFQRFSFNKSTIVLLFLSPFIYFDLGIGNCEWMVLLGATIIPAWGAWVVILKPQASIVLLGLWIKQKDWLVLLPIIVLGALFIFGLYNLPDTKEMSWSADIWPYGIPVGFILAYMAFKKDNILYALAAAPFLSPYVAVQGWIYVLLPMTKNNRVLSVGVMLSWVAVMMFLMM